MKRFARAVAAFGLGSAAGTVIQVLKGKVAAVLLGTAGMGVLNQLTSAWSLFSTVAGLGLGSGAVKRLAVAREAGDADAIRRQVSSALGAVGLFSLALALVATPLAGWLSALLFHDGGERRALVLIVAWGIPFAVCAQVYRAMLSAAREARALVLAQVSSDLIGLALFLFLIWRFDLAGAVVSLALLHAVKFTLLYLAARRRYGGRAVLPSPAHFDWRELRENAVYGANGLLLVATGILVVLLVTRWIIADSGLDAAGIFSTAWKVATVYLGAIYASAGSYYFPALAVCDDDRRLCAQIDEALTVYMVLVPPVIAAIVLSGEWLMPLLFSDAFAPAAALLLVLLPGDFCRVIAETLGLSLLARRHLLAYCGLYFAWAASYLLLAALLLPRLQLAGVALAYLSSQAVQLLLTVVVVGRTFSYRIGRHALYALLRGALLVAVAVAAALVLHSLPARIAAALAIAACWLLLSWRDLAFRELASGLVRRLRGQPTPARPT